MHITGLYIMHKAIEHDVEEAEFYDDGAFDTGYTAEEAKAKALFDNLKNISDSYIAVHRQPHGGNKPMEFVCRVDADEYDIGQLQAHVQSNYGGGVYRFMGYANGQLRVNKKVSIASPAASRPVVQSDSALQAILMQMEKMQQQILSLVQQPRQSVADLRKEVIEDMKSMRDLFGGSPAQSTGIDGILTVVNGLKTLGVNVGLPDPDGNDSFSSLLEKFVPLATALVQQQPQRAPQARQVRRQQNPQLPNREKIPAPQAQPQENEMLMMLKMGVAQLLIGAKRGTDPYDYAAMVIDNVDADTLKSVFTDPTSIDQLIAINHEVGNHRQWFVDLGEHIKARFGMPSAFDDLYEDQDGDNLSEIDDESAQENDGKDQLHNAGNSIG